jgi:hypothetical protein
MSLIEEITVENLDHLGRVINYRDWHAGVLKGIDKLGKLNREIHHDIKTEKVAVIAENIQITEIL